MRKVNRKEWVRNRRFKFLEHTADVKFQAFGKKVEKAFSNSALALKETMCRNMKVEEKEKKSINIRRKDFESLLYSFLEEILFMLEAEDFMISKISSIKIDNRFGLKATVVGDKASNYKFTNPVKAITYNEMFVKWENDSKRWVCQVVLDV